MPVLDPILLLAGRPASVTAALEWVRLPRRRPPARASSRGLAWPRGPVPPGPEVAGARCLGASPPARCARRRSSAFPRSRSSPGLSPSPQSQPPAAATRGPSPAAASTSSGGPRAAPRPRGRARPWPDRHRGSAQQPANLQPRIRQPPRLLSRTIPTEQTEAIARGLAALRAQARPWPGKAGSARAQREAGSAAGGKCAGVSPKEDERKAYCGQNPKTQILGLGGWLNESSCLLPSVETRVRCSDFTYMGGWGKLTFQIGL